VRGTVTREDGPQADSYFQSRNSQSRLGAWASQQSRPLASRDALVAQVEQAATEHGPDPIRPPFWGGFRICPVEIEFWADGASRLHDRFRWSRQGRVKPWEINRLYP
jgi:pyridoxamine 5'-phosphate oxidase